MWTVKSLPCYDKCQGYFPYFKFNLCWFLVSSCLMLLEFYILPLHENIQYVWNQHNSKGCEQIWIKFGTWIRHDARMNWLPENEANVDTFFLSQTDSWFIRTQEQHDYFVCRWFIGNDRGIQWSAAQLHPPSKFNNASNEKEKEKKTSVSLTVQSETS